MIPARKHRLFRWWFSGHARSRLRAAFSAVRAEGMDHLRAALAAGPALIVSNHTSWWDPMVVLYLTERVLRCDGHAMMDAAVDQGLVEAVEPRRHGGLVRGPGAGDVLRPGHRRADGHQQLRALAAAVLVAEPDGYRHAPRHARDLGAARAKPERPLGDRAHGVGLPAGARAPGPRTRPPWRRGSTASTRP